MKFLFCEHCKNIIIYMHESGVTPVCCGDAMKELTPGSVDASLEKHVPVIKDIRGMKDSCTTRIVSVDISETAHPMEAAHYIQWVSLETNKGFYTKYLRSNGEPHVCFSIDDDEKIVAVYSYCNLHGLWKALI